MAPSTRISRSKRVRVEVRKEPTQQRARLLVKSLLDATAAILVRHGYEGLTTNRVAEEAGVSVGSLYQYFPNKESLLAALVDRWSIDIMETLTARFRVVKQGTIDDAVRELVHATLENSRVNAKLHRILLQQVPYVQASPALFEFNRRMSEILSSWLEDHRHQIEVTNLHLAAELLVITLGSLSDYALLQRPELLDSEAYLEQLSRLVLGYLAPSRMMVQRPQEQKIRRQRLRIRKSG